MQRKLQIEGVRFGVWRVGKHEQAFAQINVAEDVHSQGAFFTWTENVASEAERAIKGAKPSELKIETIGAKLYKAPYGDPDIPVTLYEFVAEFGGKDASNTARLTVRQVRDKSFEIGFAVEIAKARSQATVRRKFGVAYQGVLKRWAVKHEVPGRFRQAMAIDPAP